MKQIVRQTVSTLMPPWWRESVKRVLGQTGYRSYSQQGEDMILRYIFKGKKNGFYVDVGAHHPTHLSNTYYFYRNGWRGLNIDATPGSMQQFHQIRGGDINLELAIANRDHDMTFYVFDRTTRNTFNEELAQQHIAEGCRLVEKRTIAAHKLSWVLDRYLPSDVKIDFLSVDVEGLDLEVLESNDWLCFHPSCVLVECLGLRLHEIWQDEVYRYLAALNYELFAKTAKTFIFVAGNAEKTAAT